MNAGERDCSHPSNKMIVGERLAYLALKNTYGMEGIACKGPILSNMVVEKNIVKITFDHAKNGLTTFGKELKHFKIAGENRHFYPVTAKIKDDKVYVSCPRVAKPIAVRYAFDDFVEGELYNTEGIPASSFRTDNWLPLNNKKANKQNTPMKLHSKLAHHFFVTVMKLIIIVFFTPLLSSYSSDSNSNISSESLIDHAVGKVVGTMNQLTDADSLPRNTLTELREWNKVGIYDWTSGFWPGILWYAYEATGDSAILENARKFTEPLKGVLEVPVRDHDLGFMFYCSYGNGYRLTKDSTYKNILLNAADSLATLYNPKVGTILSWPFRVKTMNWPHNTIIDNMMNLELLFLAAKNGGSQKLYDIAKRHAETCMTTLIRPDFSIYHVAVFDTTDGHFIKGVTCQGYNDESMWARGQAWGIYGYAMTYRETKDHKFLETAMKLADVFLDRLPEDGIPYRDFDDPSIPDTPKDASAAAIAAFGLLELASIIEDLDLAKRYREAAIELFKTLSTEKYLSKDKNSAILMHSTGHYSADSEVDASIIYADYYYLESLLKIYSLTHSRNIGLSGKNEDQCWN